MSEKHDQFWREQVTSEDYADPNISTDEQVKFLVSNIKPAVYATDGAILDYGCGYGRLTLPIKKAFMKSMVMGYDINESIIKKAKELAGYKKNENPTYHRMPLYYVITDIANPKYKVDAIYCVQVMQHWPNDRKRKFIQDAATAINRAGVLIFQYVEGTSDTFLTHDAEFKDVSEWLTDAGFEVASVEHNLIQDRWTWVVAVKG